MNFAWTLINYTQLNILLPFIGVAFPAHAALGLQILSQIANFEIVDATFLDELLMMYDEDELQFYDARFD